MLKTTLVTILTTQYNEFILITDKIIDAVAKSGIKNGMVTVISKHTTTGIAVNEALECLESDLDVFLKRLAPEDGNYAHARMLRNYGSTAGNPTGHLKAHITGNHCHFIISECELDRGSAQDVYFCEFDGPAERTFFIQICGD